jgi:hypothetical protein
MDQPPGGFCERISQEVAVIQNFLPSECGDNEKQQRQDQ